MPERFSRLVIMNTWLHHDEFEYSPSLRNWISHNEPGGLFRDNVPERFGWGTLMVIGTRRADPRAALVPALQGDTPTLSADVDAVRAADENFTGAWGRRGHEQIAHSTWDEIADAGHFLQDTHGDRVARIVLDRIDAS